jgi:hypothetical protein
MLVEGYRNQRVLGGVGEVPSFSFAFLRGWFTVEFGTSSKYRQTLFFFFHVVQPPGASKELTSD